MAPLAMVGPLGIVAVSVLFIVAAIAFLRLPAFFALMMAAALVALMASAGHGGNRFLEAIKATTAAFGVAAGQFGFTIALAAVIGLSLMGSGAAEKIVRRMIAVLGENRASIALLVCSFFLSAPVFVDTVFMLLLPLACALSVRTRKDYLLNILAVTCGGMITNGTVPPAPGPLAVAELIKVNLGAAIVAGALFGIIPAIFALAGARWFNDRMQIAPRAAAGSSAESLAALAERPESELPGFWVSIAPVFIPFALIAIASTLGLVHASTGRLQTAFEVLGERNVALLIGATIAVAVHARQKKLGWRRAGTVLGTPLEAAGVIILMVSAGSAYGAMIKQTGLGDAVRALVGGHAINYVLLAWAMSAAMRAAQGSATVAMITGAGITVSVAGAAGFGVHPLYILVAAGYGSKFLSWMNDAGFWVISRVSGLTQGEALRSWSILACGVSLVGLIEVLIVSTIWPHLPF